MLAFSPQSGELVLGSGGASGGSSTGSGGSQAGYTQNQGGTVSSPGTAPTTITFLGISPAIDMLRWIALLGVLISGGIAVYAFLRPSPKFPQLRPSSGGRRRDQPRAGVTRYRTTLSGGTTVLISPVVASVVPAHRSSTV
jgi:hypothetical protein